MKTPTDKQRKKKEEKKEIKENPEFDIKIGDLDKQEFNMCACQASDDNPYQ